MNINCFLVTIIITMIVASRAVFLDVSSSVIDMQRVFRNISSITMTACQMECSKDKLCYSISLTDLTGYLYTCRLLKRPCKHIKESIKTGKEELSLTKPTPNISDWILQSEKLCFGATNNGFGEFKISECGKLIGIRFEYLSGFVKCYSGPESRWGCKYGGSKTNLGTLVTDNKDKAIFPPGHKKSMYWYSIQGTTNDNDFLTLLYPDDGINVINDNKLRVWFFEDWAKKNHGWNSGRTCAKVFAKFAFDTENEK